MEAHDSSNLDASRAGRKERAGAHQRRREERTGRSASAWLGCEGMAGITSRLVVPWRYKSRMHAFSAATLLCAGLRLGCVALCRYLAKTSWGWGVTVDYQVYVSCELRIHSPAETERVAVRFSASQTAWAAASCVAAAVAAHGAAGATAGCACCCARGSAPFIISTPIAAPATLPALPDASASPILRASAFSGGRVAPYGYAWRSNIIIEWWCWGP